MLHRDKIIIQKVVSDIKNGRCLLYSLQGFSNIEKTVRRDNGKVVKYMSWEIGRDEGEKYECRRYELCANPGRNMQLCAEFLQRIKN